MPVLNEAQSIEVALESALRQEAVLSVIVMDGGSVDGTVNIVRNLAAINSQIQLVHNAAGSIPAGLNLGLSVASGDYVVRLDGHATVSPDYVTVGLEHLESDPTIATVGGKRIGVAETPTGRANALALSSRFGVGNSVNHYGSTFTLTDHASFAVSRRSVLLAIGGWDETLLVNEDVDLDHRILAAGHHIAYEPRMRIYWHVRESISALFRQYRRYGRGKAHFLRKNGIRAMKARHYAAPLLVVASAAITIGSFRLPELALAFTPYALVIAYASSVAWSHRDSANPPSPLALPASFLAMHFGWGLGFLEGTLLRRQAARASARGPLEGKAVRTLAPESQSPEQSPDPG